MTASGNDSAVGHAILEAASHRLMASDTTFQDWLDKRELSSLLPELNFSGPEQPKSQNTKLCRSKEQPAVASVEITPLASGVQQWLLLRVQLAIHTSSFSEYRDVVTNLPDRRALDFHRAKWKRDAKGEKVPHALLFMDLDNFKQVNDELGHVNGDRVLTILAERWQKSLRGSDLIVRYGGDEFVALLAGIRSPEDAKPIIERLISVTSQPIALGNSAVEMNASIGVALADDTVVPLEELLAVADQKMYAAKRRSQ
jgi:diguanylate cyclase (GGDEF)-like protein